MQSQKGLHKVLLFILESLGSTELLFILAMALVFFGPRKLPQISRTIGKSMAEFRRASEDFKRTWDREANMEDISGPPATASTSQIGAATTPLETPSIAAISPDQVIARQNPSIATPSETASAAAESPIDQTPHVPKHDWL